MLSALLVTRWRLGVVDYVCDDSRVWTRRAFACFLAGLAAVVRQTRLLRIPTALDGWRSSLLCRLRWGGSPLWIPAQIRRR